MLNIGCLFFPVGVVTDRLSINIPADHNTAQRLHLFDDAPFLNHARSPRWGSLMNIYSWLISAGCLTNIVLLTARSMQVALHVREDSKMHDFKADAYNRATPRESPPVVPAYVFAIISMICTSVIALCVGLLSHSLFVDGGDNAVDTRLSSGSVLGLMGALLTPFPNFALGLRFRCGTALDATDQDAPGSDPLPWRQTFPESIL